MTQYEKIIAIMMGEPDNWWHAEDLMQQGDYFVGYKAQARISELALKYPEMIERQMSSKGNRQHMYKFRMDNGKEFLTKLPQDLRDFVFTNKPWGVQI